jgi:hypothetical protein
VIGSNFPPSKRIRSDADADSLSDSVDINGRLRGPGDRNVSSPAEKRFDFHHRPANASPVEQIARPWHGDGGEHSKDADRDDKLDDSERVSHGCLSFRQVSWLNSI